MYQQFEFAEAVICGLRGAFTRERTFEWARTFIVGQATRSDDNGLSGVVRGLMLRPSSYCSLDGLFRSDAWSADGLTRAWCETVGELAPIEEMFGRMVLASDGVKVSKEGERMPGVKRLHQLCCDVRYVAGFAKPQGAGPPPDILAT